MSDKPPSSVELFRALDEHARSLGRDTSREVRRQFVEYFRAGKWWFTLDVRDSGVLALLSLDVTSQQAWASQNPAAGPAGVRRRGMGEAEYSVDAPDKVADARPLIKLAYDGLKPRGGQS